MDKAATLGDAVEYIKELEQEIKKLRDEIKENEEEDFKKDNNAETKSWILDELPENTSRLSPTHENKDNLSCIKTKKTQVKIPNLALAFPYILLFTFLCMKSLKGGCGHQT